VAQVDLAAVTAERLLSCTVERTQGWTCTGTSDGHTHTHTQGVVRKESTQVFVGSEAAEKTREKEIKSLTQKKEQQPVDDGTVCC